MIAIRKNQALGLGCRVFEPTPRDIRRACDAIQATWSPRERAKRSRMPHVPWWLPPTIRLSDLIEAMNGEQADGLPYLGTAGNEAER